MVIYQELFNAVHECFPSLMSLVKIYHYNKKDTPLIYKYYTMYFTTHVLQIND